MTRAHVVFRLALPAAFGLATLAAQPAVAGWNERYAPRPPIVLSPDLAEPWIMQLMPHYRSFVGPAPAAYPAPQPVYIQPQPLRALPAPAPTYQRQASVDPVVTRAPAHDIDPKFMPTEVAYSGPHKAGTIVVDTSERFLYLVEANGQARRYGIGVGRPGFQWSGEHQITRKAEWPGWTPPDAMLKRQPHLPRFMAGGPANPLGARAMYLGSTEYRIHGSNEPWTIGHAVSSGCIRMRNEDVTDLYDRVPVGTKVIVM